MKGQLIKEPLVAATIFFCLALLLLPAGFVSAQGTEPPPPTDDDVNAIARDLYCPVCENVPLDVCGTQACEQWRELIREKLSQGWEEQQIKDYFVVQYGDRVLAEPPRRGLNWLVYILPPFFFLIGGYVLFRVFKSMKKPPVEAAAIPESLSDDDPYLAKIEDELRRLQE